MKSLRAAGWLWLLAAPCVWAQGPIHFKTGTVHPARRRLTGWRAEGHFVVQFRNYPGPEIRAELARRHIRVLGYVPDSALMVSSTAEADLDGLGVNWAMPLAAADKISPAVTPGRPEFYLVSFYADVDPPRAVALAQRNGFDILNNPSLLPNQLLLAGSFHALPGLAAADEVSYIMPASSDLVAGNPVMACAGPLAEAGPVGDYVLASPGWAKDAGGGLTIGYFFDSLTGKLDPNTVRGEIERAFSEWQKYANLRFAPAAQAGAARSIEILFARGAHGDQYPFTSLGTLAHTFYPSPPNAETIAGDMHFNDGEDWHAGSDMDLFTVALHEAGHALGLGHSDQPEAVMYPYYHASAGLTDDDIAGVQKLYGSSSPAAPSPPTPPPAPAPPPVPAPTPAPAPPAPPTGAPPALAITTPAFTIVSTASASLAMRGTASGGAGIASVKWSTSTGQSGVAAGTSNWSATVPLLVGNNVVTIRAYDAAGNSAWRAITAVRQ